jgi:hypothetical protein
MSTHEITQGEEVERNEKTASCSLTEDEGLPGCSSFYHRVQRKRFRGVGVQSHVVFERVTNHFELANHGVNLAVVPDVATEHENCLI